MLAREMTVDRVAFAPRVERVESRKAAPSIGVVDSVDRRPRRELDPCREGVVSVECGVVIVECGVECDQGRVE